MITRVFSSNYWSDIYIQRLVSDREQFLMTCFSPRLEKLPPHKDQGLTTQPTVITPLLSFCHFNLFCLSCAIFVRDGLPKKSSCSFGFCPNYLDPPPPLSLIWRTCTNYQCAKKIGQGSPPPSPSPNWPNIWVILRCWGNSSMVCQQNSDAL